MKRIISLLISLIFLLNGAVFAEKQVENDENVCRETTLLAKLQFYDAIQADSAKITRAEFARILAKIDRVDLSEEFSKGAFFDIPQGDSDAAVIDYVYNKGYMTVQDNKFLKNDNLQAEDAVYSAVMLLGYNTAAHTGGYMQVADSLGLTKGMRIKSGEIDYRSLSKMLYAAINAPMYFDVAFTNGKTDKSILKIRFDLESEEGVIEGSFGKYLYGMPKNLEQNEILINGRKYITEDSELQAAIGYSVTFWYSENHAEEREIFCYEFDKSYETVKMTYSDLEKQDNSRIVYYQNRIMKNLKCDENMRILRNSKPETDISFLFADGVKGDVTFILKDGKVQTVIAYEYKSYAVKSIKNNEIKFKYDSGDIIDLEDDDVTNVVYIDGFPGSTNDIAVGNIISVAYEPGTKYRFLFVSTDYFEGTVSRIYEEEGVNYYTVNGVNYPVDAELYDKIIRRVRDTAKVERNQDYAVYLDIAGEITDVEDLGYNKYMYGYLTRANESEDADYKCEIRMYSMVPKGENRYTLPEKITFNGVRRKTEDIGAEIVNYYRNSSLNNPPVVKYKLARNGNIEALTITIKQTKEDISDNYMTMPYATGEYQFWEYYNGWKSTGNDPDMTYVTYMHQWDDYEATCFRIPSDRSNVSKYDCGTPRDMDMKGNGVIKATFSFYDVDEFNRPACVVYNAASAQDIKLENRNVIGIEKVITTLNDDDEICLKVCGYMHGKYVERMVYDEDAVNVFKNMKKGDFAAVILDSVTNDITKAAFYMTADPDKFDPNYFLNNHASGKEGSFQKGMLIARVKDSTKQMISLNGNSKIMTTIIAPDGNYREGDSFRINGGYTIYDCEKREFIYGAFFDELQEGDLICASTAKNLMYSFVVLRNSRFDNWQDIIPPNMKK